MHTRSSHRFLALTVACFLILSACTKTDSKPDKTASQQIRSALPDIKSAPIFSGTTQQAKTFQSSSLQGSVWLSYFFFTSCGGPCPAMNARVEALQTEFSAQNLKFIGISVDPETDTPSALQTYAKRYHADSTRWTMLQMPMDSVKSVAVQGFLLAQGAENEPSLHSTRFVVVDKRGMIRGYFDGLDENEIPKLRKAIKELLEEN